MTNAPPNTAVLESLAGAWLQAKADEKAANDRRLELEKAILERATLTQEEGTTTAPAGRYAIKIGFSMTRSVDEAAIPTLDLPEDVLRRLFLYAPKLDLRELRSLQQNDPRAYAEAARAITAKPSKPSIAITEL